MKILIIDDEYYVVEEVLKKTPWDHIGIDTRLAAYNARQARATIEKNPDIDIILTDIEMPQQNGIELIEWVYQQGVSPVIIMLTGHERFDYAKSAIRLRVLDYLTKPLDIDQLETTLKKAVNERKRHLLYPELYASPMEENDDDDPVGQIIQVIRQNLSSPDLNRQLIADVVHMNPDYISNLFHKKTGVSLSNFILNERLKATNVMLSTTNLTLQQISAKAGFSSPTYFHRQFKRRFGITPQQYRKENRVDDQARYSSEPSE